MKGSLAMNYAAACGQRTGDSFVMTETNCTLKSVRLGIVMNASMFEDALEVGTWQIDHATVVWTDVL